MGILALPFNIAANRICQLHTDGLARSRLLESAIQIVDRYSGAIARRVYSPPGVDQFTVRIEDIEVRRPQGPVGPGNVLGFVVQVLPGELMLLHTGNHMGEIVVRIGVLAI